MYNSGCNTFTSGALIRSTVCQTPFRCSCRGQRRWDQLKRRNEPVHDSVLIGVTGINRGRGSAEQNTGGWSMKERRVKGNFAWMAICVLPQARQFPHVQLLSDRLSLCLGVGKGAGRGGGVGRGIREEEIQEAMKLRPAFCFTCAPVSSGGCDASVYPNRSYFWGKRTCFSPFCVADILEQRGQIGNPTCYPTPSQQR